MQRILRNIRNAYTQRAVRHVLQSLGLPADLHTSPRMYSGSPEFVLAAALARATVGA